MKSNYQSFDFPSQRVSASERNKPEWYANCCDWVIAQAQGIRDKNKLIKKYNVLNGNIPDEFYKKILNPYNATNEKFKRFPATMRNYDLIKGIVRRYLGEYLKNPHDFIVGANNPEVVLAKNSKLRQELAVAVEQKIAARIQELYQQHIQEGNDPNTFNPQQSFDIEGFINEFNENYIDEISQQGQEILNVIKDITEDTLLYVRAYFDFVSFGECYTYSDVVGNKLIKRVVEPINAYPVPNDSMFVEDHDMFAERRFLTYQQIIDEFSEYMTAKEREFIDTYYAKNSHISTVDTSFYNFYSNYPELCAKFNQEDREAFKTEYLSKQDINSDLYEVWHVVWRGEIKMALVQYINQSGFIDTRLEQESYKLNPELGDLSIEYIYKPQVFESVRIGTRETGIYPYKARAIAFDRNGKLPYNGVTELLPGFGKFSIVEIVAPYQVFYNIVAYHREMALAKNKLSVLLMAKSLLGDKSEEVIYRMLADGILLIDDTEDAGMLRAQQIRMLNTSIGDYISQLSSLLLEIEQSAKNQVDMTPQRYGEIANSAGKGVTDEAITRGSMGSIIVEYIMDAIRERDYLRDMDYSKLAWIDGLDTSYRDIDDKLKYFSLNIDNHVYADYVIKAKNSTKEQEKLSQLKQYAFNASQNGDTMMAIAAIAGDNVSSIVNLIKKYNAKKEEYEMQLKQMDQQLEQLKLQTEVQLIQAKGEEDRKTEELRGIIDKEIALIKADSSMLSFDNGLSENIKTKSAERIADAKNSVEREKVNIQRQKNMLDAITKQKELELKNKEIDTNLEIAKENKNRYDVKSKATNKSNSKK